MYSYCTTSASKSVSLITTSLPPLQTYWGSSGTLCVEAAIDSSQVRPGTTIAVNVRIDNASNARVRALKLQLLRVRFVVSWADGGVGER